MTPDAQALAEAQRASRSIREAIQSALLSGHKQAYIDSAPLTLCLAKLDSALSALALIQATHGEGGEARG